MGRIPQRRRTISPSLIRGHGLLPIVIMIILALRIRICFPKQPALVDLAHWPESRMVVGRLEHHVLEALGLLHGLKELIGLFERSPHGRDIHRDVLAVFEHFHAMLRVVRRIGCSKTPPRSYRP